MFRRLDDSLAVARVPTTRPPSSLSLRIDHEHDGEGEVIRSDFDRALRQAVNEFVGQVFETLEHMVDEQMVGLIEWFGGNVCRYHFFKAVVEHTAEELSGEFDDDDDIAFDMDDDDDSFVDATAQSMPIRHVHRLARHEHHAINAFCTSIDNSRVVIPDNVQQMIATIPDWLRPSVRVVDGTLVRELIVERHERTEVTDLPVYGWEPAVIIGHFVLTGWGPREIEQQRQQIAVAAAQVRPEESNKWVGLFWLTVAAVVATGLLARSVHPTFAIVSTVLVVFAVWCLMRGLDQQPQPPAVNR